MMHPTCDLGSQNKSEEKSPKPPSSGTPPHVHVFHVESDLSDPGPFYGMFDGHDEEDISCCWSQVPCSSPRRGGCIPEASEIFQRVMRQLDVVPEVAEQLSTGNKPEDNAATTLERKTSKVKKSASFSASTARASSPSSTPHNPSSSGPDAKRRMSVPCIRSGKHVQWADEAGVSNLVSVRLIKPRLGKSDKEEGQSGAPARSILRRLSGMR